MDSSDWDKRHAERAASGPHEPSRILVAEADDLPPGRALDLACGTGRHAVWLAERGWRVTGVDFSEVALELARTHAAERGVALDAFRQELAAEVAAHR